MTATSRPPLAVAAIALELFLALGALGGGLALICSPSGAALGLPAGLLAGSRFGSYLVPGLVLFTVLGLGPLAVAWLAWRRHPWAPPLTVGVGVALLVWMAVEIVVVGYASEPPLQPIYLGLGVILGLVGLAWWRPLRRS
jgi:hypothetical protein